MKRVLIYIAAFIIIFAVFFLAAEILFRVFRGMPESFLAKTTQADKYHLYIPNTSTHFKSDLEGEFEYTANFNKFGYRGKDFDMRKKEGVARIFVIGDSFTFGVGAEDNETIPYLIGEKLRAEGVTAEVINAGAGHTSPINHYVNLHNIHLKYKPDLVILLYDMTDLRDDWQNERNAVYDKAGEIVRFDPTYVDGKRRWWLTCVQHSSFCKWFHDKVVRLIGKIRLLGFKNYISGKREGKHGKGIIASSKQNMSEETILKHDILILMRGQERRDLIEKYWNRCSAKHLSNINQLLSENNIPLIIVVYPYGIHVGKDQWTKGRTILGFKPGKIYTDYHPFELMESFAKKNNISFINTLESFLRAEKKQFFFDYDGHLTPEGNKIVSLAIVEDETFRDILNTITPTG